MAFWRSSSNFFISRQNLVDFLARHLAVNPPVHLDHVAHLLQRLALADAALAPTAVDYINAHGTGTADNDLAEAKAIRAVFGDVPPAVSSTKRFFGHTLAAAGAIEAVVSVLALEWQAVPPNLGLRAVDPRIPLTPVAEYRPAKLDVVMSTSLGFGGNNSAVLLQRPGPHRAQA